MCVCGGGGLNIDRSPAWRHEDCCIAIIVEKVYFTSYPKPFDHAVFKKKKKIKHHCHASDYTCVGAVVERAHITSTSRQLMKPDVLFDIFVCTDFTPVQGLRMSFVKKLDWLLTSVS